MYSRRDRRLVVFYQGYCPAPGLVVEADQPEELLERMNCAARDLWRSPAELAAQPHILAGSLPLASREAG
ncbi:hypothetical protein [Nonomuraea sp. KM90]|uniref:hypothetical protein n=1 Tax=Nonomuraea sp. KM90 TaxID=3457428 RepID=UPI003FCEC6D3